MLRKWPSTGDRASDLTYKIILRAPLEATA